ncbi:hypothetical protein H257_13292, partial [Aphanomyces astaci]
MSESNLLAVPSEAAVVDRLIAHCDGYDVRRQFEQFAAMFVRLAQSVGVLILSPAHFYASHADLFSDFDVGDEHSHDRHALFQAYEAMFESILNEFLTREQVSPADFYHQMTSLQNDLDCPNAALNLAMVLSSALNFDAFGLLMQREAIAQQQASKEADDMGLFGS